MRHGVIGRCIRTGRAASLNGRILRIGEHVRHHLRGYGGEEYGVLLPETDLEQAHRVAEVLRQRIEILGSVTISVGVASRVPPRDGTGFDDLVRAADEALYEAKRRGRNRVAESA